MKKFNLILLKNEKPYIKNNLKSGEHGIVVGCKDNVLDVLFFNPKNQGDYIIVEINVNDVIEEKEKLPDNVVKQLDAKLESLKIKSKKILMPLKIKMYDRVELLVEDKKYTKFGIHKGDTGCVMDDDAVQNYIEVDFSGIDKFGNYYSDCISVNIDDLKVIE